MINKNIIAFIKGGILVNSKVTTCPKDFSLLDRPILGSIIKELQSIGYSLCPEVIWSISDDEIISVWEDIKPEISNLLGISDWSPLFPGFPDQVINLSEEEFLTEQLCVYFDSSYINKLQEKYKIDKIIHNESPTPTLTPLKAITEKEFSSIFTRIIGVNDSITGQDKDILDWYLDNYSDLILPEKISFKENLAIVLSKRPEAISVVSSINDILRVAVWKSGGDPSLPKVPSKMIRESSWTTRRIENPEREKFKFSNFPRKDRDYILGLINRYVSTKGMYPCICDAKTYSGRWLRLGEILHPGEYKKYPDSMKFFDELRNNAKAYQTWWSKIHEEYKSSNQNSGSLSKVIELISQRPGVLIRRFDSLLRRTWKNNVEGDIDLLLDKFISSGEMNNKTLLEFYNYLDRRTETSSSPRMIKIKGTRKRINLPRLEPLDEVIVGTVKDLVKKKIFNNYQTKESLEGKNIVIDDNIKYLRIPKDMRTLSESKVVIPKGSKFKFDLKDRKTTLRFFSHWIQEDRDEDLDLTAALLSEDMTNECNIGWNSQATNSGEIYAVFSGDVLNTPGNCAEYIDIRPKIAVESGYRWCIINVHNFKGRGFNTLKNWIGYCEVPNPVDDGKQWYPKDVIQSTQPNTTSSGMAAFLIDLKEQTVQFLDEDISSIPINTECKSSWQAIIYWYAHTPELGVYELLKLNTLARKGEIKTQSEYEEAQFLDEFKSSDWIVYKYQDFIGDYTKILELLV